MKADLHIHSTYSDSSRSPEEIVSVARERNISLISICDHATKGAYDYLPEICRQNNIKYILGVELGIIWNGEEIHMLAYNFDCTNEQMRALIDNQYRAIECEYIVYNMMKDYPQMSLEEYHDFEWPKENGGWKYLYYAVAKGAAKDYDEANNTIYFKYATPNHLSEFGKCDMKNFCRMVKQAGGVSVLAHPGYLYRRNPEKFVEMLEEMRACGVEGIECFYPSHSKEITEVCVEFCKRNDMRITAGCDDHGAFDDDRENFKIGALEVSVEMLDLRGILDK